MRNSSLGAQPYARRFSVPVQFESLEGRRLLSASITSVPVVASPPSTAPVNSAGQVTPIGTTLNAQPGVAFPGSVGSLKNLTALPGLAFHATIDWGDGSAASAGTIVFDASGAKVTGSHTYAKPGNFSVTVQASASPIPIPGGPTPTFVIAYPTIHSTANVVGTPVRTSGWVSLHLTAGKPFTGIVGFYASPVLDPPLGYAASIRWGDGTTSAGTLAYSDHGSPGYKIIGSHTYAKAGTFDVTVTVTEGPVNNNIKLPTTTVAIIPSKAYVTAAAQNSVTLHESSGKSFTANVGSFETTPPLAGLRASINWGDGSTSAGTVTTKSAANTAAGQFSVAGTHTYAKAGTYAIQIVVTRASTGPITANALQLIATINSIAVVTDSTSHPTTSPVG